jgi:anti-sigma factor RsiW
MRDIDQDWSRLGAYADGELTADEASALEARLAAEPDLKYELERIRDLKRGLAALRPSDAAEDIEPGLPLSPTHARRPRCAIVAAAAALVAVIAAVATVPVWWPGEAPLTLDPVAIHERLSSSTYVVDERPVQRIVSGGSAFEFRAPDLTGSRLYLVDVVTSRSGATDVIGMHYRGMRGCRLTIVATYNGDPAKGAVSGKGMIRAWSHGGVDFAVIANGMDEGRFASIADFAQAAIGEEIRRQRDLRTAMMERYRAARPCA